MFSILSIVFLPINFQNYQASKVHKILYTDFIGKDFFKDTYNTSYEEMLTMLPNFPELDAYGRSIGIMKAFFAYNSKEKEKAIIHISEAQKDGPFHSEPHGLKALLYYQDKDLKNKDSAFYYAKKAFEIQPSKKQNFQILRRIYAANNDTVNLIKTLNVYTSVRKSDVDGWIKKAEHLYVYKKGYKRFLEVIDSGLIYSPTNEKLLKYKKEKGKFGKESKKIKQQNNVLIEKYYDTGINFFNKKEYGKAKKELTKVLKIDEGNMAATVNLGVLERILKNYKVSINHLTKVIDKNFMKNGVPEYNRGLCHYKLGDNDKALKDFEISKIKGHKSAQKMIDKIKK